MHSIATCCIISPVDWTAWMFDTQPKGSGFKPQYPQSTCYLMTCFWIHECDWLNIKIVNILQQSPCLCIVVLVDVHVLHSRVISVSVDLKEKLDLRENLYVAIRRDICLFVRCTMLGHTVCTEHAWGVHCFLTKWRLEFYALAKHQISMVIKKNFQQELLDWSKWVLRVLRSLMEFILRVLCSRVHLDLREWSDLRERRENVDLEEILVLLDLLVLLGRGWVPHFDFNLSVGSLSNL